MQIYQRFCSKSQFQSKSYTKATEGKLFSSDAGLALQLKSGLYIAAKRRVSKSWEGTSPSTMTVLSRHPCLCSWDPLLIASVQRRTDSRPG